MVQYIITVAGIGNDWSKACIPPETAFALGNFRVPNAEKVAQTT